MAALRLVVKQYQDNRLNAGYAVNNLIYGCTQMLSHKSFKLIHVLKRIHNQLFAGPREERKKFWKWFFTRFKRIPDTDNRFKPLYHIITPLLEIQSILFCELPGVDSITALQDAESVAVQPAATSLAHNAALPGAVTGIPAKCLEQVYDKPDIIMFSVINYDFRFQRPQHFAKRFSENGHRVFYINANFINPECTKEIEPEDFQRCCS